MPEKNRCVESGCPGFCCFNIDIEVTASERRRIFPKAIEVESIVALAKVKEKGTRGVFYTKYTRKGLERGDFYVVTINGMCPNKLANGNCDKHEEREHAARNFRIGSPDCNDIRAEHGLPPIYFEAVE
jgi:hypothetical protein